MAYEWGPERFGIEVVKSTAFFPHTVKGIFVDVETTETEPREIVGACVYAHEWDSKKIYWFDKENIGKVKELMLKHGVRGHNVKFDIRALFSFDEQWPEVLDDTMILAYSYSSVLPAYGLKDLAGTYCNIVWPKYRDIVGKGRGKVTLEKQPEDLVMSYCGMDVYATAQLFEVLRKKLTPESISHYQDLELPTYRSLMKMEKRGVMVDVEELMHLKQEWEMCANINLLDLRGTYGEDFNPGSPKQVISKMFMKLNINEKSTDKKVLRLYKTVPDIQLLLSYRKHQKLVTTYADALLERAPTVHCTFNQISFDEHAEADATAIKTTRLSSSDPNLQNIPARSDEVRRFAKSLSPGQDLSFWWLTIRRSSIGCWHT
jgi:DNA polymerase I